MVAIKTDNKGGIRIKEKSIEQAKYILDDPCIHKIVMYFKNKMMEELRVALLPFKDKITMPLEIRIVFDTEIRNTSFIRE